MQGNLQELHDLIQDAFPKIESRVILKILFSIKERLSKYEYVWFSRYEDFGISEKKLRGIIEYLREFWILELSHTTISTKKKRLLNWDIVKCNVYTIPKQFKEMFLSFERFVRKTFEYINPITFMKTHFSYIEKRAFYAFKLHWVKYKIHKRWKFAGKIFDTSEKKIVNPLLLSP